jgi:hypothetical protein
MAMGFREGTELAQIQEIPERKRSYSSQIRWPKKKYHQAPLLKCLRYADN